MAHNGVNKVGPDQILKDMVRVGKHGIFIFKEPEAKAEIANETTVKEKDSKVFTGDNRWYPWGPNNLFPQDVMKDARKSNVLKRGIKTLARVHYGTGPIYYTLEVSKEGENAGEPTMRRLYIPQIEDWMEEANVQGNQMGLILDLETFHNGWTEYYWNKSPKLEGAEITHYKRQKAVYCRHGIQDSAGNINEVYLSSKWPKPMDTEVIKLNYFSPKRSDKKYCLYHRYESMDEGIYYELAEWDTVRQNGWLEVSYTVPMIKKAIFKNQATLKYHVEIPNDYFDKNCINWAGLSDEDKNKIKDDLIDGLETYLADVENSGKSVVTFTYINGLGNEAGIKITAIDNKLKDGAYLPDATAGNAETLFALGINPGIVGLGVPGSRDSKGSGSYVREELWKMQALICNERYVSLEPLRHVSKMNRWAERFNGGKKIHWAYGDISTVETMNENKQGRKDIVQGEPGAAKD
jgi:hypothetical protein